MVHAMFGRSENSSNVAREALVSFDWYWLTNIYVSVRPRFTNWKFGRDKFRRDFWQGQTNFVGPMRLDL